MPAILPQIESPRDLQGLSLAELTQLAAEMREALCNVASHRTAHFASNLGVVELCLALHTTFDFSRDRLIWDTGHQIYPHKLITGRYGEFTSIRTKGGLMGYPNPKESDYDLFMTGHAGASVSTVLGLRSGDELLGQSDRHAVAVIGDGALPSGIVFEALNNSGGPKKRLLVILNDNKMSICPRVGSVADHLDRLRTNRFYTGLKHDVVGLLDKVPLVGARLERFLAQLKESIKTGLHGGMLFESLGFRYFGPVDGHSIPHLRKYLNMVKDAEGPVLLHVVTEKGHGFKPAAEDPVFFHTPAPFEREEEAVVSIKKSTSRSYTDAASEAIGEQLRTNPRVTVLTAAMCQGNKLEAVRDAFPDRFFDTGICESHAVAFAAGQAKAGLRPIVDIYSTFLQRIVRSDLPGGRAAESAGDVHARPRGTDRPRRPDAPRRVRHRLHAAVPEPGRDGPRRRRRSGEDARFRLGPRRPGVDPLSQGDGRARRRATSADRAGPRGDPALGQRWHAHRLRHALGRLPQSGRDASRRRLGLRRRQRPLRQAARYRDDTAGHRNNAGGAYSRRRGPRRWIRQRSVGSRRRGRLERRARPPVGHP